MPRRMGLLQQEGDAYAQHLMSNYNDPTCASKIEIWRNRLTCKHDVNKFRNLNQRFNYRQAKQIVVYAKSYILDKINDYYRRLGVQ